jgi:hypothetical protein
MRGIVLVLDTCEHVIDAVPTMAEAAVQSGWTIDVIITSREPLRTEAEQLYQVPPLAVPAEGAEEIPDYAAVRSLVGRAHAAELDLARNQGSTAPIAMICRRLDGIPLAIEMAARVALLGVDPAQLATVLQKLEAIQQEFDASGSDGKRVPVADTIVLGGCAAFEQAAKISGHDVAVRSRRGAWALRRT